MRHFRDFVEHVDQAHSKAPDWIVWVVSMVLAFPMPFLMGFQNAIGILIIGFALWEAWKLNKRIHFELAGPFQLSQQPQGSPTVG
jgi:hypothetical protein